MNKPQTHIYEFGEFRVDAVKRLLMKGGEQIPLTPKVFETLLFLVQNSGKIIEKDELMRQIWTDTIVEENNLSQNISILRRVLGEKRGQHRFIATIPGRGFKFVPKSLKTLKRRSRIKKAARVRCPSPKMKGTKTASRRFVNCRRARPPTVDSFI